MTVRCMPYRDRKLFLLLRMDFPAKDALAGPSVVYLMVFFSSGSQCWYFSHEPSSLFHHSVLVDLSVSMMMH